MMGYALEGSATAAAITRDGDFLDTIGVDGVSLTARGGVTALSAQAAGLRRAANRAGRPPVLLFSNYNNRIGDFDEPRAHRMLVSPRKRAVVAKALARRAVGFRGVQIDLESLRHRDAKGLVAFTRAVRRALPKGRTISMAFMASGNARGYAARGYHLSALARLLDVAALMTYDQHGPWSGPGPIGALPWVKAELRYFVSRVPRRKVDLGAAAYGYQWGGGASELTVPQARSLAGSGATWSAAYAEWHATLANGRRIWWDDARSVDLRRQLAVAEHLHGLAIWQIGSSGALRP
jgi:spore germination protein